MRKQDEQHRHILTRHWMNEAGIPDAQREGLMVIYTKDSSRATFQRPRTNPLSQHLLSGLLDIAQHEAAVRFSDLYATYTRHNSISMERTGTNSSGDMPDKRLDALQKLCKASEAIENNNSVEIIKLVACDGHALRDIRGLRPSVIQYLYLAGLDRLARHFGLA